MPNITLSIDEQTIQRCREYAQAHNTSLNAMVRELLEQRVASRQGAWVETCFSLMDEAQGDSQGQTWSRDDLYDV